MAALVFGGDWVVILAAFVANIGLDYLLGVLARHNWPTFYMQVIAGFIAVLAAMVSWPRSVTSSTPLPAPLTSERYGPAPRLPL